MLNKIREQLKNKYEQNGKLTQTEIMECFANISLTSEEGEVFNKWLKENNINVSYIVDTNTVSECGINYNDFNNEMDFLLSCWDYIDNSKKRDDMKNLKTLDEVKKNLKHKYELIGNLSQKEVIDSIEHLNLSDSKSNEFFQWFVDNDIEITDGLDDDYDIDDYDLDDFLSSLDESPIKIGRTPESVQKGLYKKVERIINFEKRIGVRLENISFKIEYDYLYVYFDVFEETKELLPSSHFDINVVFYDRYNNILTKEDRSIYTNNFMGYTTEAVSCCLGFDTMKEIKKVRIYVSK